MIILPKKKITVILRMTPRKCPWIYDYAYRRVVILNETLWIINEDNNYNGTILTLVTLIAVIATKIITDYENDKKGQ